MNGNERGRCERFDSQPWQLFAEWNQGRGSNQSFADQHHSREIRYDNSVLYLLRTVEVKSAHELLFFKEKITIGKSYF